MKTRKFAGTFFVVGLVASLVGTFASDSNAVAAVAMPASSSASSPTDMESTDDKSSVPETDRDSSLGDGWESKQDVALTAVGDETGFHILTARLDEGYQWDRLASLRVEGFVADRWIGNACTTGDQEWVAVVYAPRVFTNDEVLFSRGGFAAVVNVGSGEAFHIDGAYSLAYFNPGCGAGDRFSLTQYSDSGNSRVSMFSASDLLSSSAVELDFTVTETVPSEDGVLGVAGRSILHIGEDGAVKTLVEAEGLVFDLAVSAKGALGYLEYEGETSRAMYVEDAAESSPEEVASGPLGDLGFTSDTEGHLYVTGDPTHVADVLPPEVEVTANTEPGSSPSSSGEVMLSKASLVADVVDAARDISPDMEHSVSISGTVMETGASLDFIVPLIEGSVSTDMAHIESSLTTVPSESPTSPISEGSGCAVPRNDPAIQALQPRPAEVEWAVNQAVRQTLHPSFPLPTLAGGGRVPAQIMLGILAQESNFWQASRYTVPGVTGNPLVGNYFGTDRGSASADAWWQIDYQEADCGYGIAQVTDGMRSGDMPYSQQLAIATDYQANISRGLQILIEKWNENYSAGLTINDGDPQYLENWFYALWTYNTGFKVNVNGRWGVGWLNNPINPLYPPNRTPFLEYSPTDAAHPQDWPYPEKVLGFAAYSVEFLDSVSSHSLGFTYNYVSAFTTAWWPATDGWNGTVNRSDVKPPIGLFCDASNECDPTNASNPCSRADSECWFHKPAVWKSDCDDTCGYESLEYSLGSPKPAIAASFPPSCSPSGLPAGALIVDSVPTGTMPARSGCSPAATTGSFQFNFPSGVSGKYPAKIDVHQLGSGFNGQFYFSHTRVSGTTEAGGGDLLFSGKWSLGQTLNKWTQIYVHMPSHGAWLQQATYDIFTGTETVSRSVNQRTYANEWVSLGVVKIDGSPTITLSNSNVTYPDELVDELNGIDDIAWDAVAFVPLAQKPTEFIVALGDSYSSGEGTSLPGGYDFFRSSDHDGGTSPTVHHNGCHRTPYAWSSLMTLPTLDGGNTSVGDLADYQDPRVDYQLLACSGAIIGNVRSTDDGGEGRFLELPQLDRGFLDENTTLVTLTIGGNDVGFGEVLMDCVMYYWLDSLGGDCGTKPSDASYESMQEKVDDRLAALRPRATSLLEQIHAQAPNAKILLLGYPKLFASPSTCVYIVDDTRPWLNDIADRLNQALTGAAADAGSYVFYADPEYAFEGHKMCDPQPGITGLMFDISPGDVPAFTMPGNPSLGVVSAQSIHPTLGGSDRYAFVAEDLYRATRTPVSATIVGGAPTTYYATFRLHTGGPATMTVTDFTACGGEIRIGLRKNDAAGTGVVGEQDTETLSWTQASIPAIKNFMSSADGSFDLPSGWYAMNARMVDDCGSGVQAWDGVLQW